MSFLNELKRRNVFRVAIGYVVLSWLMAQVADLLLDAFGAPGWVLKSLLALFLIGFPFVLFVAWAYELTPEGLKRESEADPERTVSPESVRRLDLTIIVLLLVALGWYGWDRFQPQQPEGVPTIVEMPQEAADVATMAAEDTLNVVAVLPFKSAGSDDGGFLASGLHDDLLTRLAKLNAFMVISRTSMMEYSETTKNMRQIGAELGAGFILEGGVQARGNRVRVNAQLIDALSDTHLWAEVYDRELTAADLFDIQAELAMAIADALHTVLSPEDQAVIADLPTRNLDAYNAYLRGLSAREARSSIGGALSYQATAAFEEAVRLDPDFALAWARLSTARSEIAGITDDPELAEAALAALARSRALQPGLLEAELAWVDYLYRVSNEYRQALEALDALAGQTRGHAESMKLRAYLHRRLGDFEAAYQVFQQARSLFPRDPNLSTSSSVTAILLDDCTAARGHIADALLIAPEDTAVKISAADYEMECNGDAGRASELLKNLDFQIEEGLSTAFYAACLDRDFERALALTEVVRAFVLPLDSTELQIRRASVFLDLSENQQLAQEALDRAEQEFSMAAQDPEVARSTFYAELRSRYHALRDDVESVPYWIAEHKQRYREQFKGEEMESTLHHADYAADLARVGLYDEAIAELRTMLEQPGGHRFPYFDGLPVFDGLRDHPGYVELRQRFGDGAPGSE